MDNKPNHWVTEPAPTMDGWWIVDGDELEYLKAELVLLGCSKRSRFDVDVYYHPDILHTILIHSHPLSAYLNVTKYEKLTKPPKEGK